jgi:hypothetical protein
MPLTTLLHHGIHPGVSRKMPHMKLVGTITIAIASQ